jgi:hypothetical protein
MSFTAPFRWIAFFCLFSCLTAIAQDQPTEPKKYMSPQARMAAAKTVYLRNGGGTDVPFNVIQAGIESWPHYVVVNSPEKADLIIEVISPEEVSKSSSVGAKVDTKGGSAAPSSSASPDFAAPQIIKLTVTDAKTKVVLYSVTERPKNAWKEKARTDSQIECAQKLLALLHNRVEPPEAPPAAEPAPK